MKILVLGATGLIGTAVCARLRGEGHDVVELRRRPPAAGLGPGEILILDMASVVRPEEWTPHLAGIDAVVNCAGVFQDNARDRTAAVHEAAPAALFQACERLGVRRVIHFSAIGVDRSQPSDFSRSKYAGDLALMKCDLDWVILRPSMVLGRPVFGASALIRGLAALPILPVMPGTGPLQTVELDDVVSTVVFFLDEKSPSRIALDVSGPERFTMAELVARYRRWFGWRPARPWAVPHWTSRLLYRLGDITGGLGWRPPMRSNTAKEIVRGAVGDPGPWIATTGIEPRTLAAALAANPTTVQERWFARLYFIKPLILPSSRSSGS